ncbi:MAG: SpoIID/LytB domain-containing protein [Eubacteriales bacterium]
MDDETPFKIGLRFGSSATFNANSLCDGGYTVGYYEADQRTYHSLYNLSSDYISVVTDQTCYVNTSGNSSIYQTSGSGRITAGQYHVQLNQTFSSLQDAASFISQNNLSNAFPAYENGICYVRVGNFVNQDAAVAAAAESAFPAQASNNDYNRLTIVDMRTGKILLEYLNSNYPLTLRSRGGEMKNGSTYYAGDFQYRRSGNTVTLINVVDIQDYLKGVVPIEMSSSWELEALKAQAVAARNYALKNRNKHSSYGFDLCNGTNCQAYVGTSRSASRSDQAVDETDGMVLTYNDQLCELYYHASSGGMTENSENVWVTAIPYLTAVETPYETLTTANNGLWTSTVTPEELTEYLQGKGYDIGLISDFYVSQFTDAGNVYAVKAVDVNGKSIEITKATILSKLSAYVKSLRFTITRTDGTTTGTEGGTQFVFQAVVNDSTISMDPDQVKVLTASGTEGLGESISVLTASGQQSFSLTQNSSGGSTPTGDAEGFVIDGRGWGHNVGMSQRSAQGMAEHGWTYEEILTHFFQGTTLTRIN